MAVGGGGKAGAEIETSIMTAPKDQDADMVPASVKYQAHIVAKRHWSRVFMWSPESIWTRTHAGPIPPIPVIVPPSVKLPSRERAIIAALESSQRAVVIVDKE
jgi:hypothetical protein